MEVEVETATLGEAPKLKVSADVAGVTVNT